MSATSKLRALMAKANDEGCSKAEAEEALKLAQKIAAKHNLKLDELDGKVEGVEGTPEYIDVLTITSERFTLPGGMSRLGHPANHLFTIIATSVAIRCVFSHPATNVDGDDNTYVTLFGPQRLIDLAKMLYQIIRSAMDTEWPIAQAKAKSAKRRNFGERISKTDFQTGMRQQFETDLRLGYLRIERLRTPVQTEVHKTVQVILDKMMRDKFDLIPASFDNRSDTLHTSSAKRGMAAATKYDVGGILTSSVLNRKRLT